MTPRSRSAPRREYHHGDLRRALLAAAARLLRAAGPDALTLRAVARAAGVSQTAPYRHFADRRALVVALAEESFAELERDLLRAAAAPEAVIGAPQQTPRGGLQAIALQYVRFALAHPSEYRVMFGAELSADGARLPSRQKVFTFLRVGIERLQEGGLIGPGDSDQLALTCWALVHGLVMLALDGQLHGNEALTPESLTLTATEALMFGLAGR
jgi:AcrR family transcriptional regulator